ncbi:MAG: hypothetical protein MI802_25065, partial [Desulfobacterales bacterium]|nr:hypothetical protein [Desulfobacterales bacterium]
MAYDYDSNGNLIRVTYADDNNGSNASGFEYRYEDPNDPNNMTAKYDLDGNLLSTWSYDDQDRAIENVTKDGKGVSIDYSDPENISVTDAYGVSNTFQIAEVATREKVVGKTGASNCNTCSSGIIRIEYDSKSGYPTEREYANGRIDQYADYDTRGNPGKWIQAADSDEEITTTTTWHHVLSQPLTRIMLSALADDSNPDRTRIITWDYDDPAAEGDTDTPNENPTNLIHRMILNGFTHDAAGAVTPFAQVTLYKYNDKGQVISVDGPLDGQEDTVSFAYDSATGDLLSVTRPLTGAVTFSYDAAGNMITATDENQVQTTFTYDGRNRRTSSAVEGAAETQTFTAAGTPKLITDRAGRTRELSYDTKGLLQRLTDSSGNYLLYTRDENGNPVEESIYSAAGVKTLFRGYDYGDPSSDASLAPGKPAKALARNAEDSATLETLFAYEHGNLVQVTDPMSTVKTYTYDLMNRLSATSAQQTDSITADTLYGYDHHGNLIGVTDPEGLTTIYTWDDASRLTAEVSPDRGTIRYVYDTAGNLVSRTANDGTVIRYTWDAEGRRTGIQYDDASEDVLFFYDQGINGKGRLTGISHDGDAYAFSYDSMGNLVTAARTTAATTFTTTYAYDAAGLLSTMTYPDGRIVTYERDSAGNVARVITEKDGTTRVLAADIVHRPFGPMAGMTLGSGLSVETDYDLNYRPLSQSALGVFERALDYDPAGRISAITDHLDNSRSQTFGYDRAGRLTNAQGAYGSLSFVYDKTGNRLSRSLDGALTSYGYSPGSNLLSRITGPATAIDLTRDLNGRLSAKADTTYRYNQAGRLSEATRSDEVLGQYIYNSFGQRTKKISGDKTTLYHYDLNGNLIAESTPDGGFFIDYIYLDNTRLAAISTAPDNVFTVSVATGTGRPLAGVRVYAFTESGSYTGTYATTDSEGLAVFQKTALEGSAFTFRADYLNEQFWTAAVSPDAGGTSLVIPEVTQPVTVIQNDTALPGVKVYVFDETGRYLGLNAVTGSDGRVSFDLPMGHEYRFRADILGQQFFSDTIVASGQEVVINSGGGELAFTLTRTGDLPLTGVKTYVFSESGSYLGKSAVTDSLGKAVFDLPSGTYTLRCDYLGYQFWSDAITMTTGRTAALDIPHRDLILTAEKINGGSSVPAAGIKTYLFTGAGSYLGISGTTDSSGYAVFSLPEKAYKIRGDYLSKQYWSEAFTWTDPTVTISQGTLTLSLTNAGQPLPDVKTYVFSSTGSYLGLNAVADSQGQVSYTLPEGTYKVRADWLGSQYWSEEFAVIEGQNTQAELSTGGGSVTLTAGRDADNPLSGVKAYLFSQGGAYLGQNATTAEDGSASFTMGDGTYKVRLDYLGYRFWSDEFTVPDTDAVNMTIAHNTLTATVTTANGSQTGPLSGAKVYVFTESGSYMGINATTDASGQAVLKEEPPVAWQDVGAARVPVEVAYLPLSDGSVGFQVGEYDPEHTLHLDPFIVWATFIGGSGTDRIIAVDVD